MKLHTDDFAEGIQDILELYKQGNNIFEMKGGSIFPHNTSQRTWQFAKHDGHVHFSDGTQTYSFKGDLSDIDTELEKVPEVPFQDILSKAQSKGKAQVHRSDPGSIYFTLQEGRLNPTYTLKHQGDSKWKAIHKPRKAKDQLKQPVTPPNVNLEHVKEGMLKELEEEFTKVSFFEQANQLAGKGVEWLANAPGRLAMLPARMTGPVTRYGDLNQNASEGLGAGALNAGLAGAAGAGLGGAFHLAKRNLLNTPEENQQEDEEGGHLMKRMAVPGLTLAGMNFAGRSMFPRNVNNPELTTFYPKN